jgi:hypothetical protein
VTEHIVQTEKRLDEGDRYPHEIGFPARGTSIIPQYHLGRWTDSLSDASGRLTRADLNASVVAIAPQQGRPRSDPAEAPMAIYESRDGDLPPSASRAAAEPATQTLARLNEAKAPAGRRFVPEDALYLIEDPGQGE